VSNSLCLSRHSSCCFSFNYSWWIRHLLKCFTTFFALIAVWTSEITNAFCTDKLSAWPVQGNCKIILNRLLPLSITSTTTSSKLTHYSLSALVIPALLCAWSCVCQACDGSWLLYSTLNSSVMKWAVIEKYPSPALDIHMSVVSAGNPHTWRFNSSHDGSSTRYTVSWLCFLHWIKKPTVVNWPKVLSNKLPQRFHSMSRIVWQLLNANFMDKSIHRYLSYTLTSIQFFMLGSLIGFLRFVVLPPWATFRDYIL